jgi:hypothetical protein
MTCILPSYRSNTLTAGFKHLQTNDYPSSRGDCLLALLGATCGRHVYGFHGMLPRTCSFHSPLSTFCSLLSQSYSNILLDILWAKSISINVSSRSGMGMTDRTTCAARYVAVRAAGSWTAWRVYYGSTAPLSRLFCISAVVLWYGCGQLRICAFFFFFFFFFRTVLAHAASPLYLVRFYRALSCVSILAADEPTATVAGVLCCCGASRAFSVTAAQTAPSRRLRCLLSTMQTSYSARIASARHGKTWRLVRAAGDARGERRLSVCYPGIISSLLCTCPCDRV